MIVGGGSENQDKEVNTTIDVDNNYKDDKDFYNGNDNNNDEDADEDADADADADDDDGDNDAADDVTDNDDDNNNETGSQESDDRHAKKVTSIASNATSFVDLDKRVYASIDLLRKKYEKVDIEYGILGLVVPKKVTDRELLQLSFL